MTTRRRCPNCKSCFYLDHGIARCPACGQVVSAGMPAGASSLRASDRKGWRFLGRHGDKGHTRETPFVVKGQGPDRQAIAIREAQRQALREKQAYWQAEVAAIEAEFGPLATMPFQELLGRRRDD